MIIVAAKDLDRRGVPHRSASQITVRNRKFVRGQSFSTQLRQVALDICKGYQATGVKCFVIDSGEHLTIWRQEQPASNVY